ncbi:hypothetical protein C7M84_022899 [Penaeus vannamei]|uniref:Uncharacterized protein n=1 Tax=Penaeus vannamei TaxID=6689 RepID=A0A3R7MRB8_PENVA|nr:hypothetical protein C7M84_022899 [Penaeus vannamei]
MALLPPSLSGTPPSPPPGQLPPRLASPGTPSPPSPSGTLVSSRSLFALPPSLRSHGTTSLLVSGTPLLPRSLALPPSLLWPPSFPRSSALPPSFALWQTRRSPSSASGTPSLPRLWHSPPPHFLATPSLPSLSGNYPSLTIALWHFLPPSLSEATPPPSALWHSLPPSLAPGTPSHPSPPSLAALVVFFFFGPSLPSLASWTALLPRFSDTPSLPRFSESLFLALWPPALPRSLALLPSPRCLATPPPRSLVSSSCCSGISPALWHSPPSSLALPPPSFSGTCVLLSLSGSSLPRLWHSSLPPALLYALRLRFQTPPSLALRALPPSLAFWALSLPRFQTLLPYCRPRLLASPPPSSLALLLPPASGTPPSSFWHSSSSLALWYPSLSAPLVSLLSSLSVALLLPRSLVLPLPRSLGSSSSSWHFPPPSLSGTTRTSSPGTPSLPRALRSSLPLSGHSRSLALPPPRLLWYSLLPRSWPPRSLASLLPRSLHSPPSSLSWALLLPPSLIWAESVVVSRTLDQRFRKKVVNFL